MRDASEFWEELLAQIDAGEVIPVVGSELLDVVDGSIEIPLYHAVARRLLTKYGVDGDSLALGRYHELNDAVCVLSERGKRIQDLYRPIHELLNELVPTAAPASIRTLQDLASVTAFKVFVTTTPDDLLARAIDIERHQSVARTEKIVFSPKLASGTSADLPEMLSSGYTAVCYLFGRSSAAPFVFAIHDEDTLEFIHNLQMNAGEGMRRVFSELRQQSLLFIGCNFSDWLSRFFIRVSNTQRLADNRGKREFLIEQSIAERGSLTVFLERFSPDTWVFPGTAREFVVELTRRWRERHPRRQSAESTDSGPSRARADDTFFISYSRTDLPAARQLFADLQEIGADVAWFDKSELKPGEDWEQRIRDVVSGCYLFLPLISSRTESRTEGFFREEWTLASERVRRIQGRSFIVPIVIDKDYDGDAGRFTLLPESFSRAHFGHAPDGRMDADLRHELTRLIRERRGQRPA